ncbi:hypothetical protein [Xanthobacter tagetidis]|uniref:Uncharacterized protein n=1 Tax=Xanthobacter tagetidis TaxID=60216 RepID=A0A3L7AJA1_9HYPH|nr:hypothetical protein [Xanthobacter tagetidis]MBB6308905.1 hypothetical protein [Xanthobacter tagetidis]RLP80583.1 hypothetical protein D9R14_05920 [Xanthobacter tagetidis]
MQALINGVLTDLSEAEQAAWEAERAAALVPAQVSRTQALLALLEGGETPITEAQILAAIDAMADPLARERARILSANPVWRRDDPFVAEIGAAFGLAPGDIDDLFRLAVTL